MMYLHFCTMYFLEFQWIFTDRLDGSILRTYIESRKTISGRILSLQRIPEVKWKLPEVFDSGWKVPDACGQLLASAVLKMHRIHKNSYELMPPVLTKLGIKLESTWAWPGSLQFCHLLGCPWMAVGLWARREGYRFYWDGRVAKV